MGVCCLHVDDGLTAGDVNHVVFKKGLAALDRVFDVKDWKCLLNEAADYLGSRLKQDANFEIEERVEGYVKKVEAIPANLLKGADGQEHKTALRSLTMKLCWPARSVMPDCLYEVNLSAQNIEAATTDHLRQANTMLLHMQAAAAAARGEDCIQF